MDVDEEMCGEEEDDVEEEVPVEDIMMDLSDQGGMDEAGADGSLLDECGRFSENDAIESSDNSQRG